MAEMIATRDAYGKALAEFGEKYDFLVLDADLAAATKTVNFKKAFPDRFCPRCPDEFHKKRQFLIN